jgi:HSP20 family protein
MWAEAIGLMEDAQRLHRRFFRPAVRAEAAWEPPIDVFEDERELVIVVAMPGVPRDRVRVVHEAGVLAIRGERPLSFAGRQFAVRQLEIPYGTFERRIALPAGRYEAGSPELTHGCLVIRLRKID